MFGYHSLSEQPFSTLGTITHIGSASLIADSILIAQPSTSIIGASSLRGTSALIALGSINFGASSAMSCDSILSAFGSKILQGKADLGPFGFNFGFDSGFAISSSRLVADGIRIPSIFVYGDSSVFTSSQFTIQKPTLTLNPKSSLASQATLAAIFATFNDFTDFVDFCLQMSQSEDVESYINQTNLNELFIDQELLKEFQANRTVDIDMHIAQSRIYELLRERERNGC